MASTAHFKLVLLGNAGVGKSCMVLRFVRNEYVADQDSTVGAAFLTKTVSVDGVNVKARDRCSVLGKRLSPEGRDALPRHGGSSSSQPQPCIHPSRRHVSTDRSLGHRRARALSEPGADVLPRRAG
jgi:hypothetical protein